MLEHHLGDVPPTMSSSTSCRRAHDEGRHVQRHDLVADQLVDERLGKEAPSRRGRRSVGASRSPRWESADSDSDVNPAKVGEQHADLDGHPPGRCRLDADVAEVRVLPRWPVAQGPREPGAEARRTARRRTRSEASSAARAGLASPPGCHAANRASSTTPSQPGTAVRPDACGPPSRDLSAPASA